jgi:antibiotic biosynthesis monooxygenase (ABM) superfamily enzyme
VVVTRRVQPGQVAAFEAGLRELIAAASRQPGHLSTEVLRGSSARRGREYHIVYRFADEQSLRAWHASPVRRALVVALTR